MQADPRFWAGKRVCVTGGTGFLGWHLVQHLLSLKAHVRILALRPASPVLADLVQSLDCVFADIRDPIAVRRALADRDIVFHTAGTVGVWGPALKQMHEIHTLGTQQIIQALPEQARLVHTSSVVAVGATRDLEVLTESSPFLLQNLRVAYVHAKKAAEEIALAAANQGSDVVVVNPGYLIGPEDYERSVMGRLCLRCWKGRVPLLPPGGLNFVDVRDVAQGHLLAAERGKSGRRYILGGEDLELADFIRRLGEVRGLSTRLWFRLPRWLYFAAACLAELRGRFAGREPYPSMQHVRTNRYHWYYSSNRAHIELGYQTRPLMETLRDAHEWYCLTDQLPPIGQSSKHQRKAA
jgi:dihydroflavonol-4-reductase